MTAASLEYFRSVLAAIGGVEPIAMTDTLLAEDDPAVLKAQKLPINIRSGQSSTLAG